LSKKKLLLWKHILVSLGYEDAKIVDGVTWTEVDAKALEAKTVIKVG